MPYTHNAGITTSVLLKHIIRMLVSTLLLANRMRKTDQPALSRIYTLLTGVATFLLLVGIVYSATFGSVHSHATDSFNFAANLSTAAAAHVTLSETSLRGPLDNNQCLVCALHGDFSSGTLHKPIFLINPSVEIALISSHTAFYSRDLAYSRPLSRLSGRAPPLRLAS